MLEYQEYGMPTVDDDNDKEVNREEAERQFLKYETIQQRMGWLCAHPALVRAVGDYISESSGQANRTLGTNEGGEGKEE